MSLTDTFWQALIIDDCDALKTLLDRDIGLLENAYGEDQLDVLMAVAEYNSNKICHYLKENYLEQVKILVDRHG